MQDIKRITKAIQKNRKTAQSAQHQKRRFSAEIREIQTRMRRTVDGGKRPSQTLKNRLGRLTKDIEKLKAQIEQGRIDQEKLRGALFETQEPEALAKQWSDDYPIVLMPVQIQCRFMTIKHIAKHLPKESLLDLSHLPQRLQSKGKKAIAAYLKAKAGRSKKRVPNLSRFEEGFRQGGSSSSRPPFAPNSKPESALEKVPDRPELWIRIYPDDIFTHSHEEALTHDEYEAARRFWEEIANADRRFAASQNASAPPEEAMSEDGRKQLKIAAWRAIVGAFGTPRAAWIVRRSRPESVEVRRGELFLKEAVVLPELEQKDKAWTAAPHTYALPDRFVVRLYSGRRKREVIGKPIPDMLPLGLDPDEAEDDNYFDQTNGVLRVPSELRWLTHFESAVEHGMAFRIPLSAVEAKRGFSKIVVVGLKHTADEDESQEILERLIDNHHFNPEGASILPQGTPTNNTSENASGYSSDRIDPSESYRIELVEPLFTLESDLSKKTDGQRLADALGIDHDYLHHIQYADRMDFAEAIAMNTALWPATMGYSLGQFYSNVLRKSDIRNTRQFLQSYVLGRGHLPVLRIGSQPYGFLPTTVFSQWSADKGTFEEELHGGVIGPLSGKWNDFVKEVPQITATHVNADNFTDIFLNIIGLHASSISFYQRFISGVNMLSYIPDFVGILDEARSDGNRFREAFGLSERPRLFEYLFGREAKALSGVVVDGLKLSESRGIRPFKDTDSNYIDWLLKASITAIRNEDYQVVGADKKTHPPRALLYLLLRHALLREYLNVGSDILAEANVDSTLSRYDFELDGVAGDFKLRLEHEQFLKDLILVEKIPQIRHEVELEVDKILPDKADAKIREELFNQTLNKKMEGLDAELKADIERHRMAFVAEKNKFGRFDQSFPVVTGSLTLWEFLQDAMKRERPAVASLSAMKRSLMTLHDLPSARLERLFAEHLDVCNHRLDAWQLGMVYQRLTKMREKKKSGAYLGAYGYVERLRPSGPNGIHVDIVKNPKTIDFKPGMKNGINPLIDASVFKSRKAFDAHIKAGFVYLGDDPKTDIVFDEDLSAFIQRPAVNTTISKGYIHAPSVPQAMTAAILKAGYDAHRQTNSPDEVLAVNVHSNRVRKAMYYLQGMRNGQELGALLGYRFERALYDSGTLAQYVFEIRQLYPINAGKVHEVAAGSAVESAEAFNVLDGLQLLKDFQKNDRLPTQVRNAISTASHRSAVARHIRSMSEDVDAINDLMMTESVFQTVMGSPEAASAALKIMNESGEIHQMPEVVQIPRHGQAVQMKVGIQIPIRTQTTAWSVTAASSKSRLCPSLNGWLATQLPSADNIRVIVDINDGDAFVEMGMNELAIQPIDFVWMYGQEINNPQQGELSNRIKRWAMQQAALNGPSTLRVDWKNTQFDSAAAISLMEIRPLVRSLYEILVNARSLTPEDFECASQIDAETGLNGQFHITDLQNRLEHVVQGTNTGTITGTIHAIRNRLSRLAVIPEDGTVSSADYTTYLQLVDALATARTFDIPAALIEIGLPFTPVNRQIIIDRSAAVLDILRDKKEKTQTALSQLPADSERQSLEILKQIASRIFGRSFPVLAPFTMTNTTNWQMAHNRTNLMDGLPEDAVENWLLRLSVVRPRLFEYQALNMWRRLFDVPGAEPTTKAAQLPYRADELDRWVGGRIPDKAHLALDPMSLVGEYPTGYNPSGRQLGLLIDEWTETIPEAEIDTAVAMHCNRPSNEAPQSVLLAIPPSQTGNWTWNNVVNTVVEAIEMAKKRAVEPDLVYQDRMLFRMMPSLVAAMNAEGDTPSLDFARNNWHFLMPLGIHILDANFKING